MGNKALTDQLVGYPSRIMDRDWKYLHEEHHFKDVIQQWSGNGAAREVPQTVGSVKN
jgi:hypothetical protein